MSHHSVERGGLLMDDIFDLPLREHEGALVDADDMLIFDMDSPKYAGAIAEAVNSQKELELLRRLHYNARGMMRHEADSVRGPEAARKFRDSVHAVTDFYERDGDVEYDAVKVKVVVDDVVDLFDEDFISVPQTAHEPVVGDELTLTLPHFKVVCKITGIIPL